MAELTRRYIVMPMGTEGPFDRKDPDGAFVLKPWKDPAALRALETYREHCYPELARDLAEWIAAIRSGPRVLGDVGARNEAHMAVMTAAAARPPRGPAKAKVKSKRVGSKKAWKKGKSHR
jgi:hypothetical protein